MGPSYSLRKWLDTNSLCSGPQAPLGAQIQREESESLMDRGRSGASGPQSWPKPPSFGIVLVHRPRPRLSSFYPRPFEDEG